MVERTVAKQGGQEQDPGWAKVVHAELVVILTAALLVLLAVVIGKLVPEPDQSVDAFVPRAVSASVQSAAMP